MMIFKKVTIIGVGLIGGSLGLAIKKRRLAQEVTGVVRKKSTLLKVKKFKAVDRATFNLKEAVGDADLVILAVPVEKIVPLGRLAKKFMKPNSILMDVGSVKEEITRLLGKAAPYDVDFVGAHPMAGSERSGVEEADADLFEGTVSIISTRKTAKKNSFLKIEKFWKSLGCRVFKISSKLHDRLIAEVSHTPHLVASLIAASVEKRAFKFAASGFSDTTRIALADKELWAEILMMNKANVVRQLKNFDNLIKKSISALSSGDRRQLKALLNKGKTTRLEIDKCRVK